MERLAARFVNHPYVGDLRGRGMFQAAEFVSDRRSKTPFDPELLFAVKLKKVAFELGLICYPMGGTVDGRVGDHVLLAPPFIITDGQLDELVEKLGKAVDAVVMEIGLPI